MKYLTIILVVITCLSCSKDDESQNVPQPCDTERLDKIDACLQNYFFEVGSQWVYQDTSNSQIDSVQVISWYNGPWWVNGASNCPYQLERITINYNSSLNGLYADERMGNIISQKVNGNFRLRYTCGSTQINSILISNTTYTNVTEFFPYDYSGIIYYKEGVGVIRKVRFNPPIDTTTFDLISHQVTLFPNPF